MSCAAFLRLATDAARAGDGDASAHHLLMAWRSKPATAIAEWIAPERRRLALRWPFHGAVFEFSDPDMLDACLERAPHPCLSALVLSVLRDLRYIGPQSDRVWLRCAEVIEVLDDPLFLELRDAPLPWDSDHNVGGLALRLEVSLSALERRYPNGSPRLDDEEEALLQDLVDVLRPPSWVEAEATCRRFMSAVFADAEDDGPRHVFADWAQEQGPPFQWHGELIALQLSAAPGDNHANKLDELLAMNDGFLYPGELGDHLLFGKTWERGFISKVELGWRSPGAAARLMSDPAWATVKEVAFEVSPWLPLDLERARLRGAFYLQLLDPQAMRSLVSLRGVDTDGLMMLVDAPSPWSIATLSTSARSSDAMRRLCETKNLPALRHLELTAESPPTLRWLSKSPIGAHLESVALCAQNGRQIWSVQADVSRLLRLSRATIHLQDLQMNLVRGPEHRMSDATIRGENVAFVIELLESAPEHAFTRIVLQLARLRGTERQAIEDAAARQHGLDELLFEDYDEVP